MDALSHTLLGYYIAVMVVLSVYGLHRYWMVWLYIRYARTPVKAAGRLEQSPRVTVQLPMFNEQFVAERVIEATCGIDYPQDLLQIQVLDDSTDESADIARTCCRRMAEAGHDIEYLHRSDRTGFKAGALSEGLRSATGEYVAVFDADFVPPAGFLHDTLDHFSDPNIGMVQTRWSHLNRNDSLLTRIQAMSLDAHFMIEQAARAASGRWFNFNGTAGIWRRRCIDDAGDWQHDTLTEDTDLSYRAQLAGWTFRFLPDVTCPAEIPPSVTALMCQQHRWNKGLVQNAIKLLPRILRSDAPLRNKIEAWFHLTSPLPYAFILLLSVLSIPAFWISLPGEGVRTWLAMGAGLACLAMGTLGAGTFYLASQRVRGERIWRTLLALPVLMAIGIGISVINTRAIVEALFGHRSPFVRTPKFNGRRHSAADPVVAEGRHRRLPGLPEGTIECALGLTMMTALALALQHRFTMIGAPFLLLFAGGFFAIGVPLLLGRLRRLSRTAG